MNLNQYPDMIAASERTLLEANKLVRKAQAELDQLTAMIDSTIARDEMLKNDAQRKAKRFEMMQAPTYQQLAADLQDAIDTRTACEIDLNLIRNRFTIVKLQLRESIALRELQADTAA